MHGVDVLHGLRVAEAVARGWGFWVSGQSLVVGCGSRLERMNDLTPEQRLEKHRAVRDWLGWQYRQAQKTVNDLERQIDADRQRAEKAWQERSWKVQPERAGRPAMLHRGGCSLFKTELGYLNREEALIALEEGLEACEVCRPEVDLRG